jgi:uncharacterized metal-binding protein
MPSGETHDRIAVAVSPLLLIGGAVCARELGQPPMAALLDGLLLTASHLACSHWLSPDLDLGSSPIDKRWGVLAPIWRPYERLIPHRHWLSHSGLSAFLRLAYLFVALNIVLLGLGLLVLLQGFLIGLFIADSPESAVLWRWLREQYVAVSTAGLALLRDRPAETLAVVAGAFFSDFIHTVSDRVDTARKRRRLVLPELPRLPHMQMPRLPLYGLRRRRRRPARRLQQRRIR